MIRSIDDTLLRKAKQASIRRGCTLSEVVEEALRVVTHPAEPRASVRRGVSFPFPCSRFESWTRALGAFHGTLSQGRLGFEIKYTDAPKVTRSQRTAVETLGLDRLTLVFPGYASYPLDDRIAVLGLSRLIQTPPVFD